MTLIETKLQQPSALVFLVGEQNLEQRLQDTGIDPVDIGPIIAAFSALNPPRADQYAFDIRYKTQYRAREGEISVSAPYAVIATGGIRSYVHYAKALELVDYLADNSRDPWRGLTAFADELICQEGGFEHLPPLFNIVAKEGDFPKDEHGFQHGANTTVVSGGLKMGETKSVWDVFFITVFGSNTWGEMDFFELESRIENTTEHELGHLLTLFAIYQLKIAHGNKSTQSKEVKEMLSLPVWEGLANLLCNRLNYAIKEKRWQENPQKWFGDSDALDIDESLLDRNIRNQNTSLVNELLLGILLRIWQGEDIDGIQWNKDKGKEAAQALLLKFHEMEINPPTDISDGWLLRQAFKKDKFNLREAIMKIRQMGTPEIERILTPIREKPGGTAVANYLVIELNEKLSTWAPFGIDTS